MKHKIRGDITSWNETIWGFNQKMKNIKEDEDIDLEINSYGGDMFLGIEIMNTLRSHKGNVTVTVTGIAASAASLICMGADKVRMFSNTQMMLHQPWTIAVGNAKELRKIADDLETAEESMIASYTHRIDADIAKRLLDEETYITAQKAVELGLADEIVDVEPEEVESELFRNEADEFNVKIKHVKADTQHTTVSINENLIEQIVAELQNKIQNQQELNQEPDQKVDLSKLFLNL